jgi:translation initiation factor IF-3
LAIAAKAELDLVEIVPNADPPVCRVMDYGKFRFEQSKKGQQARKKQKHVLVKEMKFRPGTEENDYQVKLQSLIRFLTDGNKAKVTIRFKGREMAHKELGMKQLERIEQDLVEYGEVEQEAKLEGRQLTMVLAPKKSGLKKAARKVKKIFEKKVTNVEDK